MPADLSLAVTIEAPGGVPASVVIDVLDAVNRGLRFDAEWELAGLRFAGAITPAQLDRALARLRDSQPNALILREARSGSIVLGGLVAGVTIWILEKTLGESLTEAWKRSDMHRQVVDWLTRQWTRDPGRTAKAIEREFREGPRSLAERHTCSVAVEDQVGGPPTVLVQVTVRPDEDYAVPRGELPRPSNDGPAADLENVVRSQQAGDMRNQHHTVSEGESPSFEA